MLNHRVRQVLLGAFVVLCAATAAFARVEPLSARVGDWLLVALLAGYTAFFGQRARGWQGAVAALVAAAIAGAWWLTAAALVSGGVALWLPRKPWWSRDARGVIALVVLNVVLHSQRDIGFGMTALVGVFVVVLVTVRGLALFARRRPSWFATATIALIVLFAVGVGGFFFSLRSAEAHLRTANREARAGLTMLNTGDIPSALSNFELAAASARRAMRQVDSVATQPARAIPVVAQHRRAITQVVGGIHRALDSITADVALVDPDKLQPVRGRFDVEAITDLQQPMQRIVSALDILGNEIASVDHPWLVARARTYLASLTDDIAAYAERAERTLDALRMAPPMLGATEPRTYFVAFTSPSEIRGSLGFIGNWAEFEVINGQIRMSRFGRTSELNTGTGAQRFVSAPDDWLEGWGRPYGFTSGEGGSTGRSVWSIITLSPQYPSTAQAIASLYPQSGGKTLDAVFTVDIDVLAALLEFTGPITVDDRDQPITAQNARRFLLLDQYVEFEGAERVDLIEAVATVAVTRLLNGALPSPRILGERLSPLANEGRVLAYATRPNEQQFFDTLGLTGDIRSRTSSDTVVVSLNNASGNKIDYFLSGETTYDVALPTSPTASDAKGTLTIRLSNNSPVSGYPDYVIGNLVGLPRGFSRLILTCLTALEPTAITVNTVQQPLNRRVEADLHAVDIFVDLPPGESLTIVLSLGGALPKLAGDRDGYTLTTRAASTAAQWNTSVRATRAGVTVLDDARTQHGFLTWVASVPVNR